MRLFSKGDYRKRLPEQYAELFDICVRNGFSCFVEYYSPDMFGNFIVNCSSRKLKIRVSNDRGQLFIEFGSDGDDWIDKEELMSDLGYSFDRHPTVCGLWSGYNLDKQLPELAKELPALVRLASTRLHR